MNVGDIDIAAIVSHYFWPFARITGLLMVAPVFNARMVPVRARIGIAVALTAAVAPTVGALPDVNPLSAIGVAITVQQILIGVAMGFALQMVFDAMVIAGQTIAMSMGLGFAFFVDSQRGVSVPVLSQYLIIMATLIFLAMNGHLTLLAVLAESFQSLPIGATGIGTGGLWMIIEWGGQMFIGALRIALPAVIALLVVNLAFGVMSRAAPTLNLFAVGFPVTMTLGFFILMWSLPNLAVALNGLFELAFGLSRAVVGA